MRVSKALLAILLGSGIVIEAKAGSVVDLGPGSFTPAASVITFSEFSLGTVNPSITLSAGSLGNVTVSFAGSFVGQTVTGGSVKTLGTVTPTGPLTLNTAVNATTVNDGAIGATSPTLSGTPTFNGPIAVYFSIPVAAVGLKGGFFDAIGGTSITAFGEDGSTLGSVVNTKTGFEFFGLADDTGQNTIKGISFYITGNEPFGFEIDDLTFGAANVLAEPPAAAPLPSTSLAGLALLGITAIPVVRRRRPSLLA